MRVLFLTGRAADGGSERFVSSLAAELSARGHECLLVYDEPGLLSQVLNRFAGSGANILTINQGIPANGSAVVTVNAETSGMEGSLQKLLEEIGGLAGVIRGEILAG